MESRHPRTEMAIASEIGAAIRVGEAADTVFGVLGEGSLAIVMDLVERQYVRYIATAREDGAVLMADSFSRLSGRVGLAAITHGPALTNAITALTEAARAGTPLLLLVGAVPVVQLANPQRIDQQAVVLPTGADFIRVRQASTAAEDTRRALRVARLASRPVVLEVPTEFFEMRAEQATDIQVRVAAAAAHPSPVVIGAAAELLRRAERPLILAGRGAVAAGAGPSLRELAESTGALLATTLVAKGLFDGDSHDLGLCGGFSLVHSRGRISDADVVIAFGAALNSHTTDGGQLITGAQTLIQVDHSVDALGRWVQPTIAMLGDAAAAAGALVAALSEGPREPARRTWRTTELAAAIGAATYRAELPDRSQGDGVDLQRLVATLDDLAPADRIVVVDGGHAATAEPSRGMRVSDARSFVFPVNFGSIGLGLASAIGAACARPRRPVYGFVGDGGLMMALPELATAVAQRLPLVVVVLNDRAYGWEYHQMKARAFDTALSEFDRPDFALIAEGFGATGRSIRSLEDLRDAAPLIAEPPGPVLLDVHLDREIVTPWYAERFLPR